MSDRRGITKRWWFWVLIGLLFVLVSSGCWVGARALQAKAELETSQGLVSKLKAEVLSEKVPAAKKTVRELLVRSAKAQELTSDPIWRAAEVIPVLGRNLTVVRELAAVTNNVVADGVNPLVKVFSVVSPASLAPKDGAINFKPFEEAEGPIKASNKAIQSALATTKAIDTSGTISQLAAAKTKLSKLLSSVAPLMNTVQTVLPLLAPALGSEAPRNYVVMFQNNAEARSLGGTALSFALITVDNGKISPPKVVPAGLGNFPEHSTSVIPIPDGVQELYAGTFGTFIANATVRPNFTSAAEITNTMWKQQFGLVPDGVISIDPVALSYFLRATGPIPLSSGDVLTDQNLVAFLLNEVYQRYNTKDYVADNKAQNAIYSEAVSATFDHLSGGKFDAKLLIGAVIQGATEHRLLFWSSRENEQKQFAMAGLSGALPKSDATTDRIGLYFQDAVGSKLDYYLAQTVQLSHAVCRTDGRETYRVTVKLTNTAPADAKKSLSSSIVGTWKQEGLQPGEQRMDVIVYAPPGSSIVAATVGGAAVKVEAFHDTDYPVGKLRVTFAPGATQSVSYDIVAAKPGKKTLEAEITPMVHPTTLSTVPLDCATAK